MTPEQELQWLRTNHIPAEGAELVTSPDVFKCSLHGEDCLDNPDSVSAALFRYEHMIQALQAGWRDD